MRILFFLFSMCCLSAQAQLPSEKFDSLTAQISKTQLATTGKLFTTDQGAYKLSFADENFVVFFATKLATKATYRFSKGVEMLYLTENIDLSRCTAVSMKQTRTGDIEAVTLSFPKGSLKTKIFDAGGELKSTIAEDELYFYYDNSKEARAGVNYKQQNPYVLMSLLVKLCYMCKVEKKTMTEKQLNDLTTAWKNCMEAEDELMSECNFFLLHYPNSLYAPTVRKRLADVKKVFSGG